MLIIMVAVTVLVPFSLISARMPVVATPPLTVPVAPAETVSLAGRGTVQVMGKLVLVPSLAVTETATALDVVPRVTPDGGGHGPLVNVRV